MHRDDYDRLEQRLSESLHNWQVLNLQILAELRPPTVTEQSIPERVKAMRERLERAEQSVCHHGWRGTTPEDGKRIVTPCPACGGQLFIGSGGHLTCAVLGNQHGPYTGCQSPSVEDTWKDMRSRLERAEKDAERYRWLRAPENRGEFFGFASIALDALIDAALAGGKP